MTLEEFKLKLMLIGWKVEFTYISENSEINLPTKTFYLGSRSKDYDFIFVYTGLLSGKRSKEIGVPNNLEKQLDVALDHITTEEMLSD